jgi:hypothetical protein
MITQAKSFAASNAAAGYLASQALSVAVVTYSPAAFDAKGDLLDAAVPIFSALGNALAPNSVPQTSK